MKLQDLRTSCAITNDTVPRIILTAKFIIYVVKLLGQEFNLLNRDPANPPN
jgi:hypothetical protein